MTEPRFARRLAVLLACALACEASWAQPAAPASSAASAAERAQKQADRTMYWIRVRADKPAPAKATPAPPPAEEPDAGLVHLESVEPEFPTTIVRRIRKGNVEVRLEVEPGGTVVGATVVETSHPGLNRSAVEALKQWRFKPSTRTHVALVNLVFDIDR